MPLKMGFGVIFLMWILIQLLSSPKYFNQEIRNDKITIVHINTQFLKKVTEGKNSINITDDKKY